MTVEVRELTPNELSGEGATPPLFWFGFSIESIDRSFVGSVSITSIL